MATGISSHDMVFMLGVAAAEDAASARSDNFYGQRSPSPPESTTTKISVAGDEVRPRQLIAQKVVLSSVTTGDSPGISSPSAVPVKARYPGGPYGAYLNAGWPMQLLAAAEFMTQLEYALPP
eukprot:scaffold706_cov418-Prasinococcus_capsulatus_cf.AAC.45